MTWLNRAPNLFALAADKWKGTVDTDVATFQSLETLFANIVRMVVAISGVALFIMVLVSGFSFLFSSGDPKKLEQAKGTLGNALAGLVVIISAYVILRIIGIFTGVGDSISTFRIPTQ